MTSSCHSSFLSQVRVKCFQEVLLIIKTEVSFSVRTNGYPASKIQGGQHGAHRTQVGPCWPRELCYLGSYTKHDFSQTLWSQANRSLLKKTWISQVHPTTHINSVTVTKVTQRTHYIGIACTQSHTDGVEIFNVHLISKRGPPLYFSLWNI